MKTFTVLMHDVDRAIVDGEEEGFVKIHVQEGTDKILGATVVARHAGEMINDISRIQPVFKQVPPNRSRSMSATFAPNAAAAQAASIPAGPPPRMTKLYLPTDRGFCRAAEGASSNNLRSS